MTNFYGNFKRGSVVRIKFNTLNQSLVPTTPSVNPTFAVYKNSTNEHTADITVTVDYDTKAGLHLVVIDTSVNSTFFTSSEDYDVVFTSGIVDGINLARVVLGTFAIENRFDETNITKIDGQTVNADASVNFPANIASETTAENIKKQTAIIPALF